MTDTVNKTIVKWMFSFINGGFFISLGLISYIGSNWMSDILNISLIYVLIASIMLSVILFAICIHLEQLIYVGLLEEDDVNKNKITIKQAVNATWLITITSAIIISFIVYLAYVQIDTFYYSMFLLTFASFILGQMIAGGFRSLHIGINE